MIVDILHIYLFVLWIGYIIKRNNKWAAAVVAEPLVHVLSAYACMMYSVKCISCRELANAPPPTKCHHPIFTAYTFAASVLIPQPIPARPSVSILLWMYFIGKRFPINSVNVDGVHGDEQGRNASTIIIII